MSIDRFHELAGHLEPHAPVLIAEILGRRFGNIVAEIEDDRDFREPLELFRRNGRSATPPVSPSIRSGTSLSGNTNPPGSYETTALTVDFAWQTSSRENRPPSG